jgi:hypothetical protein
MMIRSTNRSLAAGICCLVAAATAVLSTFLTWLQGASYFDETASFSIHRDLWQMWSSGYVTPEYSVAVWLVVGGAFVLALVGIHEVGPPILRWIDRWRWLPAAVGSSAIAVGALATEPPSFPGLWWHTSLSMGLGKWVCVAGAAIGAVAAAMLLISKLSPMRLEIDWTDPSDDTAGHVWRGHDHVGAR